MITLSKDKNRFERGCNRTVNVSMLKFVPLLALAVLTALFRFTRLDIEPCAIFYQSGWIHENNPFWRFVVSYFPWPGLAMGFGGLALSLIGLAWHRFRPCSGAGLFLIGVLALGPGLLVNAVLKPNWCRPRPYQIVEFGGNQQFVPVLSTGTSGIVGSFPSGHASIGLYLFAPSFLLYSRHRTWAIVFIMLGLAFGLMLGIGRMAQAAHFPSDIIWSAGVVYISGWLLYRILTRINALR
jgi:membrane-associated PAP2 superfamily phosphatase